MLEAAGLILGQVKIFLVDWLKTFLCI